MNKTPDGKKIAVFFAAALTVANAAADCPVLTVADAESVLGPAVMDLSGPDARDTCMFVGGSPQGTLIVQIATRDYYHQVSILEPHEPVDVGDEGRSNVDSNGVAAVQFVRGDRSATLSVRPSLPSDRDYLGTLVEAARTAAERL